MAIEINITEGIINIAVVGTPTAQLYIRDIFQTLLETDIDQVFIGSEGQEFAEDQNTVVYTHKTGEIENYPVIFDNPYASQKVNGDTSYTGVNPQFMVQETKLARRIQTEDTVSIRGVKYFVKDYHSDGVGITTVYLRRK